MSLTELLEQNPEAKKEYELQMESLEKLGLIIIEEQQRYIDALEEAAIEGDKKDVLQLMDNYYGLTMKGWEDGSLEDGIQWWEKMLEREEEK